MINLIVRNLVPEEYDAIMVAFDSGRSYMVKLANDTFIAVNTPEFGYTVIEKKGQWLYGKFKKG
jgi:hypothetical protein